jgi:hypothetical protein
MNNVSNNIPIRLQPRVQIIKILSIHLIIISVNVTIINCNLVIVNKLMN